MKVIAAMIVALVVTALALRSTSSTRTQTDMTSFQEQHRLAQVNALPVSDIEDLTFVFTPMQPGSEPPVASASR
jgi:hypothetical protein